MIFEHIPEVETMMDDIIVWGSTKEEHNARVRQVLDLKWKVNLKLNKDKCEFGVKTLNFVGDVLSEDGVKPDPRNTSAINNMERPKNKDDVRRFIVDKKESFDTHKNTEIQAYVDMIVAALPVSSERMEQIKRETAADQTTIELKETTLIGWPAQKNNCPRRIQDYWMCRAELTVADDIVFKGNKIVIPMTLRKEMLQKIHEGHLDFEDLFDDDDIQ
eukprot:XP_013994921.1 PREDICTED: uncharacterized protein K02A2.6-like [Salmo salar]